MSKVQCAGCLLYVDREGCVRFGLRLCCDLDCLRKAKIRQWEKGIGQTERERTVAAWASEVPGPAPSVQRVPVHRRGTRTTPSPGKRKLVLARDGRRCRMCRVPANHLHHINYKSEGGNHAEHNLITLCQSCHAQVHSDKRKWKPLLLGVIWCQYVEGTYMTVPQLARWLSGQGMLGLVSPEASANG